jgi:hypothetical protein
VVEEEEVEVGRVTREVDVVEEALPSEVDDDVRTVGIREAAAQKIREHKGPEADRKR